MHFVQVALHRLGALEAEALVGGLVADVVGMPFDFDVGPARISFELCDQLIDPGPGLVEAGPPGRN